MRRLLVLVSLLSTTAFAQLSFGGGASAIPQHELVKLTGSIDRKTGSDVHGVVTATIESGWHINSNKPLDDFVIPTVLWFDPATADLVSAEYPPHTVRSFQFSGDQKLAVYEGTIRIPFSAKLKGDGPIKGKLHYQSCNDNVCLPPRDADVTIDTANIVATIAPGVAPAAGSANFTPLSAAPKGGAPPPGNDRLSAAYAEHGLPLTLLILFVGGLALNLTPCVFPMIPITMGFFAMQSDGRRSRRFALSISYVIGLVITYSVLGVFAALSGR
ncbi:MAG TPA: protein-disulfide reductase DsbD domain-containing protein, partial [Thermoanaerobaculia bacterium]